MSVKLSHEQQAAAFAAGDFDLLILSVIPLAAKVGRRIARQLSYDQDDAVSLASIAVCASIRKFDPSRGPKLSTFVWRCVSSYVRRVISQDMKRCPAQGQLGNEGQVAGREVPECLREEKKLYWKHIKTLTAREQTVLERKRKGDTFRKICVDIGVGRSRVGVIFKEAAAKIREKSNYCN